MSSHRQTRTRLAVVLGACLAAVAFGSASAQAEDINFLPAASLSVDAPDQLVGGTANLHASAMFIDIASSPYWLKIYDVTTQTMLAQCGFKNTCDVPVTQNVVTQHTYRAYIAASGTGPATNVQATSDGVVVRWGAKLVLNADTTSPMEGQTATLTAKAAAPGPIDIRDSTTGQIVKPCSLASTTTCTAAVLNRPSTHTYYATQSALISNFVGVTWTKIPA
jgi:hypothetical protein